MNADYKTPIRMIQQVEMHDSDTVASATLSIWEQSPESEDEVRLQLELGNELLDARSSRGYFHALCDIRARLEVQNIFIACYGSSKNVYPSPMIEVMGNGEKAYKLTLGKPAVTTDLVSIFDRGQDMNLVTVAEQRAFYERWLESLR